MKLTLSARRFLFVSGWVLSALASRAAAPEADAVVPVSLAGSLERAAGQNPALAAQRFDERAADALIEQAGYRPNPTLDVSVENVLGTGHLQGVRGAEATVQASQTLERGAKRTRRIALATREREIATQEWAVKRSEVLAQTAHDFTALLAAQERAALAAEPLRLAQEILAAVDARVKAGAASPAETARARAAVATAQAALAREQATVLAARAVLAANWGGNLSDFTTAAGRIRVPETLPAPDSFLASLAQHPRLAAQRARIEQRRANLELEQAQARGDVSVGGGVRFLRDGSDAALVAGVSVPLPTRNRNQGNIRAARETLAGAEHSLRAVEAGLQAEFTAAWQELKSAHASALALRQHTLPATAEAYAIVRRGYDEGLLPLLEVFDAQRALADVRREILEAEVACVAALTRVESFAAAPTFPVSTVWLASE